MSQDRELCGIESVQHERDAQQLRTLLERSGYSQAAAATELQMSERDMRSLCTGRQAVPRFVLYAMRWVAEHKPNRERWLQVHWKKVGRSVRGTDKFEIRAIDEDMLFLVNGEVVIHGRLEDLEARGLVTMHTSYSADRFLWRPATI